MKEEKMKLKYLSLLLGAFLCLAQGVQAMNDDSDLEDTPKCFVRSNDVTGKTQVKEILEKGSAIKTINGTVDIRELSSKEVIDTSNTYFKLGVTAALESEITSSKNADYVKVAQQMQEVFQSGKMFTPIKVSDDIRHDRLFRDRVRTLLRKAEQGFWKRDEQCVPEVDALSVAASLLTYSRLEAMKALWR
ncbi:MAG: hypothetical protein K2W92_03820 [Alphaproteobacteria bacterium]|nr:hypothetical protein [Alphaproteobacteria bacterium]